MHNLEFSPSELISIGVGICRNLLSKTPQSGGRPHVLALAAQEESPHRLPYIEQIKPQLRNSRVEASEAKVTNPGTPLDVLALASAQVRLAISYVILFSIPAGGKESFVGYVGNEIGRFHMNGLHHPQQYS